MLNNLKTYLNYGNRACGLEHATINGVETFIGTILIKRKKKLDVEATFKVSSIEQLSSKIKKTQHVFLIINNDQVLTKSLETTPETNPNHIVTSAFPNLNISNFYYEIIKQGEKFFVSICRKTYVDDLIINYKKEGINIINISLGNNIISNITNFIDTTELISSNAKLALNNKLISSLEKQEKIKEHDYNINGLQVNSLGLLSLSGALETNINNYNSDSNFEALIKTLKNDYSQSRFFQQFIKIGLVIVLSILLVNFFVFNYYFNEVNALKQASAINNTTKQDLLKLNEAVEKSQKMVEDMLQSSSSKSSFYINNIVESLPETILLSHVNFQPLTKKLKENKPVITNTNTIIFSGESVNSETFSKWIASLDDLNWVNSIDILSYEDTSLSKSKFNLKLSMTNEQ